MGATRRFVVLGLAALLAAPDPSSALAQAPSADTEPVVPEKAGKDLRAFVAVGDYTDVRRLARGRSFEFEPASLTTNPRGVFAAPGSRRRVRRERHQRLHGQAELLAGPLSRPRTAASSIMP